MPWPASQQPQLLLATCGGGPVTPPLKMLHARPHMGGRGLPVPASPRIQHPGVGSEPAASFLPSPSSEARGSAVGVCLCSLRLACGSARMEGLSWAELHTSACSMVAGAVTDTDFRHRTTAGAQQIFGKSGGSERRVQVPASYFPSETVMLDGASRPGALAAAPGERVPPVSTRTRCGWVCDISVGKAEARLFQERVPPPDTPKWLLPWDAHRPAFLIRAGFVSNRFSSSALTPVSPSAGIHTFITSCVGGKAGAELGMSRGL